jgi:hypothetical protein
MVARINNLCYLIGLYGNLADRFALVDFFQFAAARGHPASFSKAVLPTNKTKDGPACTLSERFLLIVVAWFHALRMTLRSGGDFEPMTQQMQNRLQAFLGATLAARQIHDQHVVPQSRYAA